MKKFLTIFGAGASFDSLDPKHGTPNNDGFRPPLTNGIFSNTGYLRNALINFKTLSTASAEIRASIEREQDLEVILKELKNRNGKPHRQKIFEEMVYYLQNIFMQCSKNYIRYGSNYETYHNMLKDNHDHAYYVTFNYDTLLENALSRIDNVKYNAWQNYITHHYPVIKLHGSWNWVMKKSDELLKRPTIVENAINSEDHGTPILGLPIAEQKNFVCPSEHLENLKSNINNFEKIVIIGWRGREPHFMDLLFDKTLNMASKKFELIIVNSTEEDCLSVEDIFKKRSSYFTCNRFPGGFTKFLKDNARHVLTN